MEQNGPGLEISYGVRKVITLIHSGEKKGIAKIAPWMPSFGMTLSV
jgi:hypothetical protein